MWSVRGRESGAVWKSSNCILLTCHALFSDQRRHSASLHSSSSQAHCHSDLHHAWKHPLYPNFPSSKRMMPFWLQQQVLCMTGLILLCDFGITLTLFTHWHTPQMVHVWHPPSGINASGCGAYAQGSSCLARICPQFALLLLRTCIS